jgi:serine/threonine-protein kinase
LRYQLGAKLGAGGMAEVFDGTLLGAEGFERRVAIKRVLTGLSEVPGFMTMFVAEAQIASRLNHTNVVSVFDFDRDADGQLYLVMEYVHGKDLARFLEAGPIAPSLAIYIATELLRGLGYAHAPEPNRDGIVHRDVSPQNLLLSYEGAVKVSDFGLAKARDGSGNARSTTVRGKPSYMSPEQCNGEALDARSDLFAVGVMLWEMVTHRSLFTGTPREIIAQVLFMDIPLPSSVRSRVPADLEAITMKLLARVPSDRYPNAEAVIAELLRCVAAPRDGRGELVHLLAQRFPDSAMRTRLGRWRHHSKHVVPVVSASSTHTVVGWATRF